MNETTQRERNALRRKHSRGTWRLSDTEPKQNVCVACSYFAHTNISMDRIVPYPCIVHRVGNELESLLAEREAQP